MICCARHRLVIFKKKHSLAFQVCVCTCMYISKSYMYIHLLQWHPSMQWINRISLSAPSSLCMYICIYAFRHAFLTVSRSKRRIKYEIQCVHYMYVHTYMYIYTMSSQTEDTVNMEYDIISTVCDC